MAGILTKKELESLDKQTLITLLVNSYASVTALQITVDQLNKSIEILTEEVKNLRNYRYDRSSEQRLTDPGENEQLSFSFNETEVTVDLNPETGEPELEDICPRAYKRQKKTKGKRESNPKNLPVTCVEHAMSEEQLLQAFPNGKWRRLPDEVYKRLVYHPAGFEVIEHHVTVYAGNGGSRLSVQTVRQIF